MDIQQLVRELKVKNDSKIVLLVADGLGGLPIEPGGPTELEAAKTPNLDALARRGVQGSMFPICPGHHARQRTGTPGPVRLRSGEVPRSAAGRWRPPAWASSWAPRTWPSAAISVTLDAAGNITDRRAGRIASEESARWPSSSAR